LATQQHLIKIEIKMEIKITKKIIDTLPLTGDKLIKFENDFAIYKSGGKMEVAKNKQLEIDDIVTGVYHGHEIKNGIIKIIVSVDHQIGDTITDDSLYNKYLRIYSIEQIIKD
jgi:hypothetical protein